MENPILDDPVAIPEHKRKRRRTRKACDQCRAKKIKCNGHSPCSSCAIYDQECTYNRQVKPRHAGPLYAEQLERKIQRLQSVLSMVLPDVDLDDPRLETTVAKHLHDSKQSFHISYEQISIHESTSESDEETGTMEHDELLDTMIEATSQLEIDDRGRSDYRGDFSGLTFIHQIHERCSQLVDVDFVKREIFSQLSIPQAVGSPGSSLYVLNAEPISTYLLPSREVAQKLTKIALTDACCLINFIHRPSFERLLNRVYDLGSESYTLEEERFLPLLYMTMAIGELYSQNRKEKVPAKNGIDSMKGAKYFRAAQSLVDVMDCRDMASLQTIIFMIIYLQSSALMRSCYSYICVAIASSLRMGLHRSVVSQRLSPIEREIRKRIFWALRTMDTYVTTMLGLPRTLSDEDIDQELPLTVDDEFVTTDGILPMPKSHISLMAAVNAHTKLLVILSNVMRNIYPGKKEFGERQGSYRVKYAKVVKVEAALDEWFRNIPQPSRLDESISSDELRIQLLLRLAYAHVQMVLYRPFIHHIVRTNRDDPLEMRSYACASACVKAAMQAVWLVDEMDNRGILIGAYWFTVYITFFAVMSLCMFILGNAEDPTVDDTMKAATRGRDILVRLRLESTSAEKCVTTLESIFEKTSSLWENRSQRARSVPDPLEPVENWRGMSYNMSDSSTIPSTMNQMMSGSEVRPLETRSLGRPEFDLAGSRSSSDDSQSNKSAQHEILAMVYPAGYHSPIQNDVNMRLEAYNDDSTREATSIQYLRMGWLA